MRVLSTLFTTSALLCLFAATPADAAQFCVNSANGLTAAVAQAQVLPGPHEIRIQQGSYNLPGGLNWPEFVTAVSFSGGWNAGCTVRSFNPALTTINGQNSENSHWKIRTRATLIIDGLRLFQTAGIDLYQPDFGPASNDCTLGALMAVRRTMIQNSVHWGGNTDAVLGFSSSCHRVLAENNLVTGVPGAGVMVHCKGSTLPSYRFINNTVKNIGGTSFRARPYGPNSSCGGGGLTGHQLFNNILESVIVEGAGNTPILANNIHGTLTLSTGAFLGPGSSGNLTVNPQLDANFRPIVPGSPAINSGTANVPGGLPDTDIEGNPRVVGTLPDRGAFESNVNDLFLIEVTNNNNAGEGSLRAAIDQANASPGLKSIQFNIPGGCPRTISLATPLPNITSPLIINGWSQPGAAPNTLENGNNATICVVVRRSVVVPAADVPRALNVPSNANATLTVRGIAFGGFTAGGGLIGPSAILLQGGSNHRIQGNQFGGIGATVIANAVGVSVQGATDVLIGGGEASQRNTIGNSSSTGLRIVGGTSGHEVINNYIGTTPAGTAAAANEDGIAIIQSSNNQIFDNLISGNSRDGIVINGENAQDNVISGNRIGGRRAGVLLCGVDPLPPCPPLPRNRKGILIDNLANGTRIGAGGAGSGNQIAYNEQHAVRVMSGQRNRILGNAMFANGTIETDIDLGAFGVNPNGNDCPGSGPADLANQGQNAPLLLFAEGNGNSGTVEGQLTSCVTSGLALTRIQFFVSTQCNSSGHGPGEVFVGERFVSIPGSAGTQGSASFSWPLHSPSLGLPGRFLSATATSWNGNTSEFSACIPIEQASDLIFRNGFELP